MSEMESLLRRGILKVIIQFLSGLGDDLRHMRMILRHSEEYSLNHPSNYPQSVSKSISEKLFWRLIPISGEYLKFFKN